MRRVATAWIVSPPWAEYNPKIGHATLGSSTMTKPVKKTLPLKITLPLLAACLGVGLSGLWWFSEPKEVKPVKKRPRESYPLVAEIPPRPRQPVDDSGFSLVRSLLPGWGDGSSLEAVRAAFHDAGRRHLAKFDHDLKPPGMNIGTKAVTLTAKAFLYLYEGEPKPAYDELARARALAESDPDVSAQLLSMTMFLQGVAGLRRGETENCVECRGEGSCIFPIVPQAVHKIPAGSRLAIQHFTEYLHRHPDDLVVQWLLNLAYMTLGEYPGQVPPEYLLPLKRFRDESEHGIGRFRDIACQPITTTTAGWIFS